MAKKKYNSELARITITFTEEKTDVDIANFHRITPRKIQKSFGSVMRAWSVLQRQERERIRKEQMEIEQRETSSG